MNRILITLTLALCIFELAAAQGKRLVPNCMQIPFDALKSFPKIEYECPAGVNDFDDKILRLPQRLLSIRSVIKELEAFTNPNWWAASVDELNACSLHKSVGALTAEEKESWLSGDYSFDLLGNGQMRLVLLADPCYQTGFGGSNAFLLYRKDGKVFVSQLLNGYYSRVDNSVGIDFAKLSGQQIIEVSTSNSMPPSFHYYYFAIDPKTNTAVPKKIFKDGKKLTNTIYSDMLMDYPKNLGLPKDASELNIIRNGRLAPTFSAFAVSEHGRVHGDQGRNFNRIIYRWNGRFYAVR
ncbi:MAG TPA: hypothetical protein VE863_11660 [Pyrinomonadaceae bacterium]|jgi:hypothetical protein|nr:hypothetical protein [Pyrinomonadaceae bacterium]